MATTTFSPSAREGGKAYYLKAKSGRTAQLVGYAVVYPDTIDVLTISGVFVGAARNRGEAAWMIDAHHRRYDSAEYRMWTAMRMKVPT
jgi:hypothetical protein